MDIDNKKGQKWDYPEKGCEPYLRGGGGFEDECVLSVDDVGAGEWVLRLLA